jgi:hypothetical protein
MGDKAKKMGGKAEAWGLEIIESSIFIGRKRIGKTREQFQFDFSVEVIGKGEVDGTVGRSRARGNRPPCTELRPRSRTATRQIGKNRKFATGKQTRRAN